MMKLTVLNTYKNSSQSSFAVALLLLLLSPVLSIPVTLWGIYKGDRRCMYLLAVICGLWAFLTPPYSDLYRWTQAYMIMKNSVTPAGVIRVFSFRDDYITQIVALVLAKSKIGYPFARFLFATISISILCYVFEKVCYRYVSYGTHFILFLTTLMYYNYYQAVIGVRHGFALTLFFLGFYLLYLQHNFAKGIAMFILASLTHDFFILMSIIAIACYFVKMKFSNTLFFIFSIIFLICGIAIISFGSAIFIEDDKGYISGRWGSQYVNTISTAGMMYVIIYRIAIIPLLFFFLKSRYCSFISMTRIRNFIMVCFLFFLATILTLTISGRVIDILYLVLILYFLKNYRFAKSAMASAIILFGGILFCAQNYAYRKVYSSKISQYSELIKPLPFILYDHFDERWIMQHVDKEGDIK